MQGSRHDGRMEVQALSTSAFTGYIDGVPVVLLRPADHTQSSLFVGDQIYGERPIILARRTYHSHLGTSAMQAWMLLAHFPRPYMACFLTEAMSFSRAGGSYNEREAYLYFCRASLEYLAVAGQSPNVIHTHEWQAAGAPALHATTPLLRNVCDHWKRDDIEATSTAITFVPIHLQHRL